jgi:hypothetical protein
VDEETQRIRRRQFEDAHKAFISLAQLHKDGVYPTVDAAARSKTEAFHLHRTVVGLHLRALGWAHSIQRLDDVFDFQGHSAGCRALFEIAVDLVLLTRAAEPVEKLLEWERLAKFRSAERAVAATTGDAGVKEQAQRYIDGNRQAVNTAQTKYWPDRRNPLRWTGSSLFKDAIRADSIVPLRLGELARDHYDRLCWGTHGSSLVLIRDISEDLFPGYSILAVHESVNLLAHVIRLVLEHFGLYGENWNAKVQHARVASRLAEMKAQLDAIVTAGESSK